MAFRTKFKYISSLCTYQNNKNQTAITMASCQIMNVTQWCVFIKNYFYNNGAVFKIILGMTTGPFLNYENFLRILL